MDRLACMRAFVEVVSSGGFTAAAERLNVSRTVVSKQVMALEAALGARLLNRTTRRVAPTEVGRSYLERCRRILAEVAEAEDEVGALQAHPRGMLKVNAPMSFGVKHLGPALAEFMCRYPDLRVQMVLNDRFVDLLDEGFDVAIRIGELADSSLVARALAPVRRVLCAAPSYLARRGWPAHPRELAAHDCLQYGYLATGNRWQLQGPGGAEEWITIDGRLCVNNGEALLQSSVAGLGIGLSPTFIAADALRDGLLLQVLPGWEAPVIHVNAVYPHARGLPAKVRAFVDFMAGRFGEPPDWDRAL